MDLSPDVNPDPRRALPSVDRLTRELHAAHPELPDWATVQAVRTVVEDARRLLETGSPERSTQRNGSSENGGKTTPNWIEDAHGEALRLLTPKPRPVVNATGVVLHTNLGRAPIAAGAAEAAAAAAREYSDLELDLESGRRGDRLSSLAQKLCLLSGAEAATACNNNAAAVMLILNALAAEREVIVSRGELVEIGGSFRVPDIMSRANVRLVEVGTTNRTHLRDYEDAITRDTALLLKVHKSNFSQDGFVKEVRLDELAELGKRAELPVVEDLGSGTLVDLTGRGFPADSYAPARLRLGADLICFSGDKLMGGPQAGLILGRADLVAKLRTNPLARALRLDKMCIAALDWTLGQMLEEDAESAIPVLRQLLASASDIETLAHELARHLRESAAQGIELEVIQDRVPVGGGSTPGFELDTWGVALRSRAGAHDVAAKLRAAPTPVLARVRDDAVLLDCRTLQRSDFDALSAALQAAFD
jgi:L-seryl-tRNA(Ser) seleniumtransferase